MTSSLPTGNSPEIISVKCSGLILTSPLTLYVLLLTLQLFYTQPVARGAYGTGVRPPFLHLKGGGHTIWDKKMKKWKEGNKKGKKKEKGERENWHKILFLSPILCVKDYFFFKFKKKNSTFWNKLFTNFYFYPVLWNDRVLIFFVFETLIVFPSYIRLIILMNHRAAKKNPETSWNLYNKTRHSYIYMYVAYSRPNGCTDWA